MTDSSLSDQIHRVVVVGAGTMGHGIAQVFAMHGLRVALVDTDEQALSKAMERIRANLELLLEFEMVTRAQGEATPEYICPTTDLATAAEGADLAVEAVVENLDIKHQIFRTLDAQCAPQAILATNTSGLPITSIASVTRRPEQVIGTHFVNPAYALPLVEVIKGEKTSEETVARTRAFLTALGKKPVVVWKDVPGFVGNRIQVAMARECFHIVEQGIASAEDVDTLVKNSFGFRLPIIGPFETYDLVGLDVVLAVAEYLLPDLNNATTPSALLRQKVANGERGVKSGKGIYDWPPEKVGAMIEKRDRDLLRRVRDQQRAES